ncbi:MAG: hypothetical protein U1E53_04680 [Dongiaceae bacterium]
MSITGNQIGRAAAPAVAGISIYRNHADTGGSLTQTAVIVDNTVASGFRYGVGVVNDADLGLISQALTISGNQIGAAEQAGIGLVDRGDAGIIQQTGTISGNVVAGQTDISGGGLVDKLYANFAGITQGLTLTNNTFANNEANGVYLKAVGLGLLAQTVSLSGNLIDNNDQGLRATAAGALVSQTVVFVNGSNNTISNNNVGVYGSNTGVVLQNISLGNSIFTGNVATTSGNATFTNP